MACGPVMNGGQNKKWQKQEIRARKGKALMYHEL